MPTITEVSLAYKASQPVETLPQIASPEEAAEYLQSIWDQGTLELREEFIVVLLNNAKKVLGWSRISSGGSTATIVEPSAVFQTAMLGKADSIIVSHNHPSGRKQASSADIHNIRSRKKTRNPMTQSLSVARTVTSQAFFGRNSGT